MAFFQRFRTEIYALHCTKKWNFPLTISSVNVIRSGGNCGFGHIYWINPSWKASLFSQCQGLIKLRLLLNMLLIEVILESIVNMNQITTKKAWFKYFCRFLLTYAFNGKDIYVRFLSIIWVLQFLSHFVFLLEDHSILH